MKKTREDYKNKFNELMNILNYMPQMNEEWVQIEEKDYLFLSNKGYLLSLYHNEPKIIKPLLQGYKGKKKDGTPKRQVYAYVIKDKDKTLNLKMHKLLTKYFPKNNFEHSLFADEPTETHHINNFNMELLPQANNNADNLQDVPQSIHNQLTEIQNGKDLQEPIQDNEKVIGIMQIDMVQALTWLIKNKCIKFDVQPYMLVSRIDGTQAQAITLTDEQLVELLERK